MLPHDINSFYQSPLGAYAAQDVRQVVQYLLADVLAITPSHRYPPTLVCVGVGAAITPDHPYPWQHSAPLESLPFKDESCDVVLLVHALEHSPTPTALLRECWRVLAPLGRLMVVAPHRRSAWPWCEHTPFGHGTPYTTAQLEAMVRGNLFSPVCTRTALHFLPVQWAWLRRLSHYLGHLQRLLQLPLMTGGGALVMLAEKVLYAPVGKIPISSEGIRITATHAANPRQTSQSVVSPPSVVEAPHNPAADR